MFSKLWSLSVGMRRPGRRRPRRVLQLFFLVVALIVALFPFWTVQVMDSQHQRHETNDIENFIIRTSLSQSQSQSESTTSGFPPLDQSLSENTTTNPIHELATPQLCLSPKCLKEKAQSFARSFPSKSNHSSSWILTSERNSDYQLPPNATCAGILYVKNFKAASSTAAGIALRLAYELHPDNNRRRNHNHAQEPHEQQPHEQEPQRQRRHAWVKFAHARGYKYAHRDVAHSLLFTSIRDPAARALSRIFYTCVTQKGETPTDAKILERLGWNHKQYGAVSHEGGGYQVRYLSPHKVLETSWDAAQDPHGVVHPERVEAYVQEIMESYDFIMVAERMDESVVVFALLMGLELGDVLVMNAKQNKPSSMTMTMTSNNNNTKEQSSNTTTAAVAATAATSGTSYLYFSHHHPKQGKVEYCKASVPAVRSQAVEAHLTSLEWYAKNYGDYLLYYAAEASLEQSIHELGKERVAQGVTDYRRLRSWAQNECASQAEAQCSSNGELQTNVSKYNCYADDSGCGYRCINRLLSSAKSFDV